MDVRKRTPSRVFAAAVSVLFLVGVAACVPAHPSPVPVAPATAAALPSPPGPPGPTLAEYVDTMAVFAHPGDAGYVHVLEGDVFGDLGQHVLDCVAAITHRESTDYWTSYNPSGATGLAQIEVPLHTQRAIDATGSSDLFNPWVNLTTMRALSSDGTNWGPWNPRPSPC